MELPLPLPDHVWALEADGYSQELVGTREAAVQPSRILMTPGGSLSLQLRGWDDRRERSVLCWPKVGAPIELAVRRADSPETYEGLPVGSYTVRVHLGPAARRGRVLAQVPVELRVGAVAAAVLSLEAVEDGWEGRVRGTVALASAWDVSGLSAELVGVDADTLGVNVRLPLAPDAGQSHVWRFEVGALPPGWYMLVVKPCNWRARLRASFDSAAMDLLVPAPGEVRLQLEDAVSREPIRAATVSWYWGVAPEGDAQEPDDEGLDDAMPCEYDDALGAFVIRAPAGVIAPVVTARGYVVPAVEWMRSESGSSRTEVLRLQRAARLVVRVSAARRERVFAGEVLIRRGSDGQGRGMIDGMATFEGLMPGVYTVELSGVPLGYRSPPAQSITLHAETTKELEVDLEVEGGGR